VLYNIIITIISLSVFYRLYFFNTSFNDLDNNRFLPNPFGLDEFSRFTDLIANYDV
jgi:hypothetical protein